MGKDVKWSILAIFIVLSPLLGILIDVCIVFPPSRDVQGHGVPVFTVLMPLFAIIIAIIAAVIELIVKASRRSSSVIKHYEYLKITQKCNSIQTPTLILHEIDTDAGRCSVRCIYIYRDGYIEKFVNEGVYVPVPTAKSFHSFGYMQNQTAYIMTGREFENVWNSPC